jgi:hypothetical protein
MNTSGDFAERCTRQFDAYESIVGESAHASHQGEARESSHRDGGRRPDEGLGERSTPWSIVSVYVDKTDNVTEFDEQ